MYGTPAYFTATVLFDLIPMRVPPPCLFAAATYWMIGFRPGFLHLCTFLLLLILTNMVCPGPLTGSRCRPCLQKPACLPASCSFSPQRYMCWHVAALSASSVPHHPLT